VQGLSINEGQGEAPLPVQLPTNAPLGTFTFHLDAQAQVNYRRNPELADRLAQEKTRLDEVVVQVTDENNRAQEANTAAMQAAQQAAERLRVAQEALATATQAAQQAAAEAAAAQAQADQAKAAADADTANAELAAAAATAAQAATDAATRARTAEEARVAAQAAADQAATDAAAAEAQRVAAEQAAAAAASRLQQATAAQQAAAQEAQNAANAANPQGIGVFVPSTTITLKITPAPVEMAAAAPGGPLPQGQQIELPVAITRLYGFNEQVELSVEPPRGLEGVQVAPVAIPAGANEAKLVVQAAANATPGDHVLRVKARMNFNGQGLEIEQLVTIAIQEVAQPPQ
jgi:hypothetical protein